MKMSELTERKDLETEDHMFWETPEGKVIKTDKDSDACVGGVWVVLISIIAVACVVRFLAGMCAL